MSEQRLRFRLIDVVVLIAIIGAIAGAVVPAIERLRELPRRIECANNLKALGLGALTFHDNHGQFPPGRSIGQYGWAVPTSGVGAILHDFLQTAPEDYTGFALILEPIYVGMGHNILGRPFRTTRPPPNNLVPEAWYYFPGFDSLTTDPLEFQSCYPWFIRREYTLLFCPSNRSQGTVNIAIPWAALGLPASQAPFQAATDYAMCKGTNAYLDRFPWGDTSDSKATDRGIPKRARGVFDTNSNTRIADITDGRSNTFLFGETAGDNAHYLVRANYADTSPALDSNGRRAKIDQSWGVPVIENAAVALGTKAYFGSYLAVTAQYGGYDTSGTAPGNPIDGPEPLNARLVMASIDRSGTPTPSNDPWDTYNNPALLAKGMHLDTLNGFRSMHPGGANFCFADGSVRFITTSISQHTYEAMSTYQGGETIDSP
jgi:prepilin-type processing-associated H-X9-DG protein